MKSDAQNSGWFQVPNAIVPHFGNMTRVAFAVYFYLQFRRNRGSGRAWPSIGRMARDMGYAKSSISQSIELLKSFGVIELKGGVSGPRGTRVYGFPDAVPEPEPFGQPNTNRSAARTPTVRPAEPTIPAGRTLRVRPAGYKPKGVNQNELTTIGGGGGEGNSFLSPDVEAKDRKDMQRILTTPPFNCWPKSIAEITSQFHAAIRSGKYHDGIPGRAFHKILEAVADEASSGKLRNASAVFPKRFADIFESMCESENQTGGISNQWPTPPPRQRNPSASPAKPPQLPQDRQIEDNPTSEPIDRQKELRKALASIEAEIASSPTTQEHMADFAEDELESPSNDESISDWLESLCLKRGLHWIDEHHSDLMSLDKATILRLCAFAYATKESSG